MDTRDVTDRTNQEACECGADNREVSATLIKCRVCGRLWGRCNGALVLDPDTVPVSQTTTATCPHGCEIVGHESPATLQKRIAELEDMPQPGCAYQCHHCPECTIASLRAEISAVRVELDQARQAADDWATTAREYERWRDEALKMYGEADARARELQAQLDEQRCTCDSRKPKGIE